MKKQELIEVVAKGVNASKKTVAEMVNSVFEAIKKDLSSGEKFSYPGFGSFAVRTRKARDGRNPRTGKKMRLKASKNVGFRAATAFKALLQKPN